MTTLTLALPALVAALGVALVLSLDSWRRHRRLAERIETLRQGLARTPEGSAKATALRRPARRASRLAPLPDLGRLVPDPRALERRLARAGLALGAGDALFLALTTGLVTGGFAYWQSGSWLIGLIGFPLGAVILPLALLEILRRRRERAFLRLFPEALDLVVRAVKSGLPVVEAVALIGDEIDEPVGGLFREVASAVRIGSSLEDALWDAVGKMDIPEFRFFVIALSIQRETGGNLAEIVANLSTLVRRREQMKMKIRAMSSEARASAMIIGALPFVMTGIIYAINPDYIGKLFVDPRGWMMIAAGLTSMTIGVLVIARLVRFEI